MQVHPVAEILPLMVGDEFDMLTLDIKAHGLREPIVLHPDGSILDGRNRYRACQRLNVEARYETWQGQLGAEAAYVISVNLRRRHLDAGQRAMYAAKLANLGQGRPSEISSNETVSIPKAAKMLGTNPAAVKRARTILKSGNQQLISAVESGLESISHAAAEATKRTKLARGLSGVGRNPARIEKARERGRYWRDFTKALSLLAGLPDPAEVILASCRTTDKIAMIDRKLRPAMQWLESFEQKWKEHERDKT